ncbi:MAG: protein-tyrosine phosphatase family protein [Caldilineaceae bacterium]
MQPTQPHFPLPHPNCYWVTPGRFLAGEYPGAPFVATARQRLLDHVAAGVTFFLDLTHPMDPLAPYEPLLGEIADLTQTRLVYQRLAIVDRSIPTHHQMVKILDTLDQALADGHCLYLHCWGGVGRTGTVVGCYLVRHGATGEAALAHLAQLWQNVAKLDRHPFSPETPQQVAMIRNWPQGEGRVPGVVNPTRGA